MYLSFVKSSICHRSNATRKFSSEINFLILYKMLNSTVLNPVHHGLYTFNNRIHIMELANVSKWQLRKLHVPSPCILLCETIFLNRKLASSRLLIELSTEQVENNYFRENNTCLQHVMLITSLKVTALL
jgi:hypothetical protein